MLSGMLLKQVSICGPLPERSDRGGEEGAQRLGRAGSHEDGANFSTYSPLATAAAEANGTDYRQKCSVFGVLHPNQEYA